jgi:hypothetical protein
MKRLAHTWNLGRSLDDSEGVFGKIYSLSHRQMRWRCDANVQAIGSQTPVVSPETSTHSSLLWPLSIRYLRCRMTFPVRFGTIQGSGGIGPILSRREPTASIGADLLNLHRISVVE